MAAERPSKRPPASWALKGPSDRLEQWKRIPRLIGAAVQLVGEAGRRHLILLALLQLATAGVLGVQVLVGRDVLEGVVGATEGVATPSAMLPALVLLVAVTIVGGAVTAFAGHQQRLLSELVGRHAFDKIIDVAGSVPLALYEDPDFYDRLARARTSGRQRPIEITSNLTALLTALITSVGIGWALTTLHPLLLPLVALAGVPLLFATLYNSRKAYEFEFVWTPEARERAYLMRVFTETASVKELSMFGGHEFLRRRYDRLYDLRFAELRRFLHERVKVSLAGTTGGALGIAIALASLAWLMVSGRVDIATAVAAGVAMQLLFSRFSATTRSLGGLVEAGMFLDDYHEFLAFAPGSGAGGAAEEGRAPGLLSPRRFEGLELEEVSFTYPGTESRVLHDVSLEVAPGEVVALVGENGSGKTTLVKLICQFYRPDAGRILWNGMDARGLDADAVRSGVTVLFQDFIQYQLSILDNIVLGRAEGLRDAAEAEDAARTAAERSGAHSFITALPDEYRTRLGRQFYGGQELSVGQWQRLALARAFFRGGDFLILDEPTAALDPRAEHALFGQMRALWRGRSVLLISHRFSSVRAADRIYVLDAGRITESGSHTELMRREGLYADLFRLQASAYLQEDESGQPAVRNVGASAGS